MIRELIHENLPTPLYRNALDAYAARHKAIAANIANASTPGYVPIRVEFEKQLANALDRRDRSNRDVQFHSSNLADYKQVRHRAYRDESAAGDGGGNGVVIEKETARLLTNRVHHTATAARVAGLFRAVRRLSDIK